jgi:toxin HigB-1
VAIQSFSDKDTKEFFCKGKIGKGVKWKIISTVAQRKLDIVHYAEFLHDLKSPPNNQREALKSNLKGLHSIRINDQWGLVFRWTSKGPEEVKIMDYHK